MNMGHYDKHQSSVQSVSFGAEFMALKRAIEEGVECRHYLRSFGVLVTKRTDICTNKISVLRNTLQNKHIALACHFCRE